MWNPNLGGFSNTSDCYPGDEYVDFIGLDTYDNEWGSYWPTLKRSYGSWNANKSYVSGEGLEVDQTIWKCLKNNTNIRPGTDSSVWSLVANETTLLKARTKAEYDSRNASIALHDSAENPSF